MNEGFAARLHSRSGASSHGQPANARQAAVGQSAMYLHAESALYPFADTSDGRVFAEKTYRKDIYKQRLTWSIELEVRTHPISDIGNSKLLTIYVSPV
ncbi:MAG: hypothetical protein AAFX56_14290 [Pseudomonadota bacterium]